MPDPENSQPLIVAADAVPAAGAEAMFDALLGHFSGGEGEGDIDPEIVKYEGEIEEDFEGCLSVKDVYGKVPRHTKVRVKALSVDGKEIRLKAEGFLARVFQHEIDHTNGILFVDHIQDKPEAFHALASDGSIKELSDAQRKSVLAEIF